MTAVSPKQPMSEVAAAVAREHLEVQTVFAMHQGPVPWKQVQALLVKAGVPATSTSLNSAPAARNRLVRKEYSPADARSITSRSLV